MFPSKNQHLFQANCQPKLNSKNPRFRPIRSSHQHIRPQTLTKLSWQTALEFPSFKSRNPSSLAISHSKSRFILPDLNSFSIQARSAFIHIQPEGLTIMKQASGAKQLVTPQPSIILVPFYPSHQFNQIFPNPFLSQIITHLSSPIAFQISNSIAIPRS